MKLIDADALFSAIGDRADDAARAKNRAEGSMETYYEGVVDGLLLAKGLIAEEDEVDVYKKLDALYKNLDAARERTIRSESVASDNGYPQVRYYRGRIDATTAALMGIAAILEEMEEDG